MLRRHEKRRRRAWGGIVAAGLLGLSSIFSPLEVSAQHPQYCPPAQPVPQYCPPGHPGYPPGYTPIEVKPVDPKTDPMTDPMNPDPMNPDPMVDPNANQPDPNLNQPNPPPQNFNPPPSNTNPGLAGSSAQDSATGFVGDFFGSSQGLVTIGGSTFDANTGVGSNTGRQKLVEGISPMPRDRVFINYSYFNNTSLTEEAVNVNRVTLGLEQTFLDGNASFEFRVPFAVTLGSDIGVVGGLPAGDNQEWEMGNLNMALKGLLFANDEFAMSAGAALSVPTGEDLIYTDGISELSIENDSVHLLPFVGFLATPRGSRVFHQGVAQFDFDLNGNQVQEDGVGIGRINDSNYLYLSYGVGYFLKTPARGDGLISSITPMAEIHYSRSISSGDVVDNGSVAVDNDEIDAVEAYNAVLAVALGLGSGADLTFAYALPLNTDNDRQFHGEVRALLNVRTGRGTSLANRALSR